MKFWKTLGILYLALLGVSYGENTAQILGASKSPVTPGPSFNSEFFDPSSANEWRLRAMEWSREQDLKERHRLVRSQDRPGFEQDQSARGFSFLSESQNRYFQNTLDKAMQNEGGKSALQSGRAPVVVLGAAAAITLGIPIKLKTGKDSTVKLRSQAIQQRGEVQFESAVLNTGVQVANLQTQNTNSAQNAPSLGGFTPGGKGAKAEDAAKVSVSKKIKPIGVGTGLTYGSTTESLTSSLSKSLNDQVTLVLDSSRKKNSPPSKGSEETVRVLYNLNF